MTVDRARAAAPRIRIAHTDELDRETFAALTDLCEAAFAEPFPPVWERVGPGIHVFLDADVGPLAHAMVVDRRLYAGHEGDLALDVGYVENVAARPDRQGEGHGSRVMEEIGRVIADEYALGALGTGRQRFYERLGWERWLGPTFVRMADGQRVRSASEDGAVMVLRTPSTPAGLDLQGPLAADWRPGRPW